jgi:hypothetical protein
MILRALTAWFLVQIILLNYYVEDFLSMPLGMKETAEDKSKRRCRH